jgi:anti-sigma factor RsiW
MLDLFVDGALSTEAVLRVEAHLMRCAACAQEVHTLRVVVERLKSALSSPEIAEAALVRLEERMLAEVISDTPVRTWQGQRSLPLG